MDEAFLYAFKYNDAHCVIAGKRFVLAKFGMATGWHNLMARFNSHQNDCNRTLGTYPRIPKHNQRSAGEVALYEKSCRGCHTDSTFVQSVDDVISAIKDEDVASRYKPAGQREERQVWPDLAYIVPVTASHASFMEGVVPWSLVTYLSQTDFKTRLDEQHQLRYPTAVSRMSHRESFLLSEHCFDRLRELFVAEALNADTIVQLIGAIRPSPSNETEATAIQWRNVNNAQQSMNVLFYKPLYAPEMHAETSNLGLLS